MQLYPHIHIRPTVPSGFLSQFSNMSKAHPLLQWLPKSLFLFFFFFFLISLLFPTARSDVGTAAHYSPPYLPTRCYGNDVAEFPSSNLFAAAADGVWDNGAACGRQYLVRCISASRPGTCVPGQTIQVKIVDYAPSASSPPSTASTTMVLSETAFAAVANASATSINIEFQQL